MYSSQDLVGSGLVFATLTALAVAYWVMLTMCNPYGLGDEVYLKLATQSSRFTGLGATAGFMTVLLVVLDILYWKGPFWYLARALIAVNVGLYFLTALAGTKDFPASPVAVYFMVSPVILLVLQMTVLRFMEPLKFLWAIGVSLMIVAITSLGIFLAYAFGYKNFWENKTKLDFYIRLECLPPAALFIPESNLTAVFKVLELDSACNEAFLFWISPVVLILFSFAMGGALMVIVHSQHAFAKGKGKLDLPVRAFLTFLLLGFLGLYCASGIGGAHQGLSSVVFTFTFLLMVIGCGAIVFIEGLRNFTTGVKQQPLIARVIGWTKSDWIRALLLVLFFPLMFVIIPLAYLNQLGRKTFPMTKTLSAEERNLTLSVEVHQRIQSMKKWHWTSVLGKVIWWGVLFFCLSVIGARFINVFFSWLDEEFAKNNVTIPIATAIYFAVGLFCFVLPPIPGVPVYIACTVILVPTCERYGWDFWAAWFYSSIIAWFIRLTAVTANQIIIGQWFGSNSVAVRRATNVNSVETRAIKKILLTKGLTMAKVAALVGGPDWPMCVAAGILRTPVLPNVLGTAPVFVIILPVTLAGALILRRNEGGVWVSAASMALALTALVQTVLLGAAAYYIEKTIQDHREELMSWPDDEEVKKFDDIANKRARTRSYVSHWSRLPIWIKVLMVIGVVCETASAYLFQLFGSQCFKNFDITDNIALDLDNNVLNVIKPLGWVGIGLFGVGALVLIILGRWISLKISFGFKIPAEDEERQRGMSEAGVVDSTDDLAELEELEKTSKAITPVTSAQ